MHGSVHAKQSVALVLHGHCVLYSRALKPPQKQQQQQHSVAILSQVPWPLVAGLEPMASTSSSVPLVQGSHVMPITCAQLLQELILSAQDERIMLVSARFACARRRCDSKAEPAVGFFFLSPLL